MTGEVSEGKREVDINTLDSHVSEPEIHARLRTYVTSRTREENDPSYDLIFVNFSGLRALVLQNDVKFHSCRIHSIYVFIF